jgi:VWFA-related protein
MGRFCRLLLFLLLPLSLVLAQDSPSPQLEPRPVGPTVPVPASPDKEITLEVQVTEKSGAPIRGLQKQDFTILDDKQPQSIVSFHAVDNGAGSTADPVQVVLVIDAVNASFQAVTYERNEVKKFLLQNGGKLALPTSFIVFSDAGTKVQNHSTRDGNALAALFDQSETGLRSINRSQGYYGAVERFGMSLKALTSLVAYEATQPGRKLMIWFSPGWPLLSGPNIQHSHQDYDNFFNSIVDASTSLRQAHITLYSIDPLGLANAGGVRISYYKEFLKGVPSAKKAEAGNLGLQVLVVQSGGRVFNSSNDLTGEISNCVVDADAFYVLSFNADRADQPNEYHSVAVTVDKPGASARTRTGYYAQP